MEKDMLKKNIKIKKLTIKKKNNNNSTIIEKINKEKIEKSKKKKYKTKKKRICRVVLFISDSSDNDID